MNKSPIGSRILSAYAVVFAGVAPAVLSIAAFANGMSAGYLLAAADSIAVAIYGVRVFRGEVGYLRLFAVVVIVHYFGLSFTNFVNYDSYPVDSRAHQMAIARMIRGVLFGSFYGWYFLLRRKTRAGFGTEQSANLGV